ncbi:uncharacterized protein FIESC28_09768 [Fusarium coffeatum]|uniref:Uncharacterized protein n=1 Tax=Fusarium coffeatum TaxID=231269 RepID=A0A366QZY3_9HYPO|nr:uncharacterized protein FIESC28_09768 [Fusarium coffeatum]RBR09656.1 hypothetical protein FIESC28_09768 [Fusarium coffeatum]
MALHKQRTGYAAYLLLTFWYFITPTLARSYSQYQHFFPAWDPILQDQLLTPNCTEPMAQYRNRSDPDRRVGYGVIDCILETMPEFRKAELASSAVILGLAPAILQLMSASYLDTAMLSFRRPGLAFLLSMASSGVRPLGAGEYDGYIDTMGTEPFRTNFGRPHSSSIPAFVSGLEYTVATAAVANNAYLAYQLSTWAVCTFAPGQDFLPAVWTVAAVAIHLVGYIAAGLKVTVKEETPGGHSGIWHGLWAELKPTPWQSRLVVTKDDRHSGWFLVLVSFLYIGDALQVFFGTLILSSLVFISVRDSAVIVIRLTASALFARGILLYEITAFTTEKKKRNLSGMTLYTSLE